MNTTVARSRLCWLFCFLAPLTAFAQPLALPFIQDSTKPLARVVVVHDSDATDAFQARTEKVLAMVNRGVTIWTGRSTVAAAWSSLVGTQDTVGIKVHASPGPNSGTRLAVTEAIIEGLLQAKILPKNIVVWDKQTEDLRQGGFFELTARYGVRVEASVAAGYDQATFYSPEKPILGQLIWGDLEFGHGGEGAGRKSYVSKLVSKGMTKIINVSPLLNHYRAGVSGNLYNLTMGSVDNILRFEADPERLANAVPEIYALPAVGDRVVLNIVDALICQYEGEQSVRLHDSAVLNELRFSTDPVALDVLSLQELNRQRQFAKMPVVTNRFELFSNASELQLGVSDPANIQVERVK